LRSEIRDFENEKKTKMKTIIVTLVSIEVEMQQLQLWSEQRPSDTALASTQPFCIDTLTLPEWIQFILLDRLRSMIDQSIALPKQCGVAPIAQEYFKHSELGGQQLTALLEQLDRQLGAQ